MRRPMRAAMSLSVVGTGAGGAPLLASLARRGLTAREILQLYYPTAKLVRLGEVPLQPIAIQTKGDP